VETERGTEADRGRERWQTTFRSRRLCHRGRRFTTLTFRAISETIYSGGKTPDFASLLGARKSDSTLLVLFIPSRDRTDQPIDQEYWVRETLGVLGELFGGATAFPRGQGVWRDDAQSGLLLFDEPVVIQCYASEVSLESRLDELKAYLLRMGREARQGAIGLVIDRDYLEIGFPLEQTVTVGPK